MICSVQTQTNPSEGHTAYCVVWFPYMCNQVFVTIPNQACECNEAIAMTTIQSLWVPSEWNVWCVHYQGSGQDTAKFSESNLEHVN